MRIALNTIDYSLYNQILDYAIKKINPLRHDFIINEARRYPKFQDVSLAYFCPNCGWNFMANGALKLSVKTIELIRMKLI